MSAATPTGAAGAPRPVTPAATARPLPATGGRRPPRRDDSPVRVHPDGRVSYYTGGAVGAGERKWVRLEDEATAQQWADEYLATVRAVGAGAPSGPKSTRTLAGLAQDCLEHHRKIGTPEGSIRQYKSNWNVHVPEDVSMVACGRTSIGHYTQIFDALTEAGATLGTIKAVARTLGVFIGYGEARDYFGIAPPFGSVSRRAGVVKEAKRHAIDRAEADKHYANDNCPTAEDVDQLAKAAGGEQAYPHYGDRLVQVKFASGLRFLELMALRTDAVDLSTGEIAVDLQLDRYKPWPATRPPKGGKTRVARIWDA